MNYFFVVPSMIITGSANYLFVVSSIIIIQNCQPKKNFLLLSLFIQCATSKCSSAWWHKNYWIYCYQLECLNVTKMYIYSKLMFINYNLRYLSSCKSSLVLSFFHYFTFIIWFLCIHLSFIIYLIFIFILEFNSITFRLWQYVFSLYMIEMFRYVVSRFPEIWYNQLINSKTKKGVFIFLSELSLKGWSIWTVNNYVEWWDLHIPILDYGIFLVKTGNIPKSSICELYPGARAAQAILLFTVYSTYYVYTLIYCL